MQSIEAGPGLLNMYLQVTERKTAGFNFFFAVQKKEICERISNDGSD